MPQVHMDEGTVTFGAPSVVDDERITQLQVQLRDSRMRHEADLNRVGECLVDFAADYDMQDEICSLIRDLNALNAYDMPMPVRDWTATFSIDIVGREIDLVDFEERMDNFRAAIQRMAADVDIVNIEAIDGPQEY